MLRKHWLRLGLAAATLAVLPLAPAQAQGAWPARPLKIVVPFPPGGNTDAIGRLFAEQLASRLGQAVVVENRAGGGGTLGADLVAKAPPDGYTLLLGTSSDQVNAPFLYEKLPYPVGALQPISLLARDPIVMAVGKGANIATIQDLVAQARANPGKLSFASSGAGTTGHLAGELLQDVGNIKLNHVPYRGSAPAIADVLGGHVQVLFGSPISLAGHIQSGAMKILGVTSESRLKFNSAWPTLREGGVAVEISTLYFLMAPTGLPEAVASRLGTEAQKIIADAATAERIVRLGAEPVGNSPAAAAQLLGQERSKWKSVIERARITVN